MRRGLMKMKKFGPEKNLTLSILIIIYTLQKLFISDLSQLITGQWIKRKSP